jgi:hypothetical protein
MLRFVGCGTCPSPLLWLVLFSMMVAQNSKAFRRKQRYGMDTVDAALFVFHVQVGQNPGRAFDIYIRKKIIVTLYTTKALETEEPSTL